MPQTGPEGAPVMRLLLLLAAACLASAQVPPAGQLLLATRGSRDPDFARTVILIVHPGPEGVVGLMLNRPSDARVDRLLPGVELPPGAETTAYAGGPIALGVNAIAASRTRPYSARQLTGGLWLLSDARSIAAALAARPASVRVYLGQCGWSRRQMENEIARKLWIVAPAPSSVVFDPHPETLWARLVARVSP